MKTETFFYIDFNYALSEQITTRLTANVQLQHSLPHYLITNFHLEDDPNGSPLLPDIDIVAIKDEKGIRWVHLDSRKETVLSTAIGKSIEARGDVEFVNSGR